MGPEPGIRWIAISLLLLPALAAEDARAWTEPTRARMIRQSTELMPDSLRGILERLESSCLEGARLAAGAGRREAEHRGADDEALSVRIDRTARAVDEAIEAIRSHQPFRQVAYRFGEVAHLVTDLHFPLNLPEGNGVGVPDYDRYRHFAESAMERFPVVLDPTDTQPLRGDRVDEYLRRMAGRSRPYGPRLEEVFRREEHQSDPRHFDDRSIAFGIASLSYSRSVSDVSRVWLYIWHEANGDMEGVAFPLFTNEDGDEG